MIVLLNSTCYILFYICTLWSLYLSYYLSIYLIIYLGTPKGTPPPQRGEVAVSTPAPVSTPVPTTPVLPQGMGHKGTQVTPTSPRNRVSYIG